MQAAKAHRVEDAIELWASLVSGELTVAGISDGQLDFLERALPDGHEARETVEPDGTTRLDQVRQFRDAAVAEQEARAAEGRRVRAELNSRYAARDRMVFVQARQAEEAKTGLVIFRMEDDSYVAIQADLETAPLVRLSGAVEGVVVAQPLKYHEKAMLRAREGQTAYNQVTLNNLFRNVSQRIGIIVDQAKVEETKQRLSGRA